MSGYPAYDVHRTRIDDMHRRAAQARRAAEIAPAHSRPRMRPPRPVAILLGWHRDPAAS